MAMRKKLGWMRRTLLLALLLMPTFQGKAVKAQDPTVIGEWEITFDVVNGKPHAIWTGRVWDVDAEGVETLGGQLSADISDTCENFGNPQYGEDHVNLDGFDDYVTCRVPDFRALFAQIEPKLVNCRCTFEGPPYASADVSPVISATVQPVIYHHRLHLDIQQEREVADLELEKSISNELAQVGSSVVFSITVTNQGPSAARGVAVEEKLPSGYTYASDNSGGTYDTKTGTWNVGNLATGASATLHITTTVNQRGIYTNTAQVTASSDLDPDSTPGNSVASEDDIATAGINPNALFVHLPLVKTGPIEEGASEENATEEIASAAEAPALAAPGAFGMAVLNLHFLNDEQKSWQSNLIPLEQANGIQVWGGYNAARYVANSDPDGFAQFLSIDGFWEDVQPGFVEGLYFWESETVAKYDDEPMPAGFGLAPGTLIYIGHNPGNNTYFKGTVRAAAVDPGCRGH